MANVVFRALPPAEFAAFDEPGYAKIVWTLRADPIAAEESLFRTETRVKQTAVRRVAGRNCLEIGGVWIDDGFDGKMKTVTVKAMSNAYFKLLEKRPELKEVLQLGSALVWITPSGTALVIDPTSGKEELTDEDITKLFTAKK